MLGRFVPPDDCLVSGLVRAISKMCSIKVASDLSNLRSRRREITSDLSEISPNHILSPITLLNTLPILSYLAASDRPNLNSRHREITSDLSGISHLADSLVSRRFSRISHRISLVSRRFSRISPILSYLASDLSRISPNNITFIFR
jgi:hypothetical protein